MVGAFGGRKCSEDFADCDADGFGRARGGLAQQVLELGEDLSIGLGSGEYFGRKKSLAPAAQSSFCRVAPCPWTINVGRFRGIANIGNRPPGPIYEFTA
jgi:hypothetical protein